MFKAKLNQEKIQSSHSLCSFSAHILVGSFERSVSTTWGEQILAEKNRVSQVLRIRKEYFKDLSLKFVLLSDPRRKIHEKIHLMKIILH